MPRLCERLAQLNRPFNSFPASTGQDSCRRAVRIVDIDHSDERQKSWCIHCSHSIQSASSQAEHTEVRQFYGAVNASKSLPERVKLPPAPKAPEPPNGVVAEAADVVSTALGFQTLHQRAMKAHAEAMNQWRDACRDLRQEDTKAWDSMKAHAAMAPLRQRRHAHASVAPTFSPPKVASNNMTKPKPR